MGRCSFARGTKSLAVTLFVGSVLSVPFLPGCAARSYAGTGQTIDAPSTMDLTGLQKSFAAVVDRVAPSVVAISASCTPVDSDELLRTENLNSQKIDSVLSKTTRTVGTGFFIDADGFIVTNEHVVCEAEQLWVTTDDRRVFPAIVIATDPRADLAVLKIPASGFTPVKFSKQPVYRGQWTIAVGNPYGLAAEGDLAMSVGVVSATARSLPKLSSKEGRLYTNLIQTTAEINPGNSGGPLFDINGDVIGVNTAVILPQKQTNGIGFAFPIGDEILNKIDHLKQGREIVYGYLGVTVGDPTSHERTTAGLRGNGGARVDFIEPKSPADGIDLHPNDIIVSVNGAAVADSDAFIRVIGRTAVDKPSSLGIYRNGSLKAISVTPRKRPTPAVATREPQRLRWRGMTIGPVPTNWAKDARSAVSGVYVVGIEDAELSAKLGVKQGSIITAVAGKVVKSVADLQRIIDATPPESIKFETADSAAVVSAQE